jgi:putative transposase
MDSAQSLCHTKWDCKYHVVWIPNCRRKVLYGRIRKHLAEYLHELARQKESKILEGHLCSDHVHVLISIPPKYSVAQVLGFIKGKSAIHVARTYLCFAKDNELFGGTECLEQQRGLFLIFCPLGFSSQ